MSGEKTFVPFNLNEYVRVKLNERGLEILRANHARLFERVPQAGPFVEPAKDADGWSRFQGWEIMRDFGPHMKMASPPPFEPTIEFEVSPTSPDVGGGD